MRATACQQSDSDGTEERCLTQGQTPGRLLLLESATSTTEATTMAPTVSAVERRDSQEAFTMLTDHPDRVETPNARGPLDPACSVGHHPPRRTLPPALASALRAARLKSGLLNRDAAARIGIDPSYLSKIVQGTRRPSLVVAERLVAVLPLSVGERAALRDMAVTDKGKSRLAG